MVKMARSFLADNTSAMLTLVKAFILKSFMETISMISGPRCFDLSDQVKDCKVALSLVTSIVLLMAYSRPKSMA